MWRRPLHRRRQRRPPPTATSCVSFRTYHALRSPRSPVRSPRKADYLPLPPPVWGEPPRSSAAPRRSSCCPRKDTIVISTIQRFKLLPPPAWGGRSPPAGPPVPFLCYPHLRGEAISPPGRSWPLRPLSQRFAVLYVTTCRGGGIRPARPDDCCCLIIRLRPECRAVLCRRVDGWGSRRGIGRAG